MNFNLNIQGKQMHKIVPWRLDLQWRIIAEVPCAWVDKEKDLTSMMIFKIHIRHNTDTIHDLQSDRWNREMNINYHPIFHLVL